MMAHALRPRILFNFFSVLPNYPNEQIQNLSFLLQIVVELKLFPWHVVGPVCVQKSRRVYFFQTLKSSNFAMNMDRALKL